MVVYGIVNERREYRRSLCELAMGITVDTDRGCRRWPWGDGAARTWYFTTPMCVIFVWVIHN